MSETTHLKGFVLARENYKEDDQIIFFYSQEVGKIEIFVRGGRKINSKLLPVIAEPFAFLNLVTVKGGFRTHLIGGETKEHFYEILKNDFKAIKTGILLKKVNRLIKHQPDKKIFFLIYQFLRRINEISADKIAIINSAFLIKILAFLGYRPELKVCLFCRKKPVNQELFFDFNKGGIFCQNHGLEIDNYQARLRISQNVLDILQKLLYQDFNFLAKEKFQLKDFQNAETIVKKFFEWHLES